MTALRNVARTATYPNFAGIPGTGPAGTECKTCRSCRPVRGRKGKFWCARFEQLTGCIGGPIPTSSASCLQYEAGPDVTALRGAA